MSILVTALLKLNLAIVKSHITKDGTGDGKAPSLQTVIEDSADTAFKRTRTNAAGFLIARVQQISTVGATLQVDGGGGVEYGGMGGGVVDGGGSKHISFISVKVCKNSKEVKAMTHKLCEAEAYL